MAEDPAALDFLILGTARSGTTLIQRMCSELPDVWVPAETHYWDLAERALHRFDFPLRGRTAQREMVAWTLTHLRRPGPGVSLTDVMNQVEMRKRRVGLYLIYESLVAAMSPPSRILGEKTPSHTAWWEQLTGAQPRLKLLGVVRDPRAVLASQRSVPWGEQDPHVLAERWLLHQRSITDAARLLGESRCLILRYENVVAEPARHQERIARFLGAAPEGRQLEPEALDAHPLFSEREAWKIEALGQITTARVEAWHDLLSKEDISIIEKSCAALMAHFEYALEGDAAGAPPPGEEARGRIAALRAMYARTSSVQSLPIY